MRLPLAEYATVVFDCDGVILDSNRVKSDAFRQVSLRFGAEVADRFVAHHQRHGGISRYRKFEWLLDTCVTVPPAERVAVLADLLRDYAALCARGLMECALIPGVAALLERLPATTRAFVVTGGDQQEVRTVFAARGLDRHFVRILGSPTTKRDNMQALADAGEFARRGLYFGDAELDMQLADAFGLDFVFVGGASEWAEGDRVCAHRRITDFTELD